jgi:hypothetical protein
MTPTRLMATGALLRGGGRAEFTRQGSARSSWVASGKVANFREDSAKLDVRGCGLDESVLDKAASGVLDRVGYRAHGPAKELLGGALVEALRQPDEPSAQRRISPGRHLPRK